MNMQDWLTETFARNKALYGGIVMELDESGNEIVPPVEGEEIPPVEGEENNEEIPPEETPAEVLRANLTKANQEAARYRTRLREVEKELESRKTPEEVEELRTSLMTERESETRTLLIENVALKFNLPPELAARLAGKTREELEEDAKSLAKFAPKGDGEEVPPGDLNGGLNPGNDNGDDTGSARDRVRKLKGYR